MNRFAQLSALANDPVAFARLRHEVLQAFINALPPGHRAAMLDLQGRIDAESAVAANPVRAARRLLGMAGERVGMLEDFAASLEKDWKGPSA